MAVYKIFSEKDTFISKHRNTQNFGRDEILEISNETEVTALNADVNRALIQFENNKINNVINSISGSYKSFLKLFLAEATLPINYEVLTYPLSQSWDMGLGKSADNPITTLGVTWETQPSYITSYSGSQTFLYPDNKDLNIDVTTIINQWNSGSINNNGLILKLSSSIEDSTTPLILKFFSIDTHTIYLPHLELKWDDSYYSTSLAPATSSASYLSITNLKSEFKEDTIYDFKIKVRDKYPARSFQTASVYLNSKCLPSSSYWGLQDVKTGEMVIDFDTNYTKISCNNQNNYFKLYMNGLEPERYYKILIKTDYDNEVVTYDYENNYFKIIK